MYAIRSYYAHQLALRRALLAGGEHYLTAAEFGGRQWLRLTLMNPDTTAADIDALIGAISRDRAA